MIAAPPAAASLMVRSSGPTALPGRQDHVQLGVGQAFPRRSCRARWLAPACTSDNAAPPGRAPSSGPAPATGTLPYSSMLRRASCSRFRLTCATSSSDCRLPSAAVLKLVSTSCRVSRACSNNSGRQGGESGSKVVAQLFQLAAQERVVEDEPAVILDHAQAFAGPVGTGVHDPAQVHDLGRTPPGARAHPVARAAGFMACRSASSRATCRPNSSRCSRTACVAAQPGPAAAQHWKLPVRRPGPRPARGLDAERKMSHDAAATARWRREPPSPANAGDRRRNPGKRRMASRQARPSSSSSRPCTRWTGSTSAAPDRTAWAWAESRALATPGVDFRQHGRTSEQEPAPLKRAAPCIIAPAGRTVATSSDEFPMLSEIPATERARFPSMINSSADLARLNAPAGGRSDDRRQAKGQRQQETVA